MGSSTGSGGGVRPRRRLDEDASVVVVRGSGLRGGEDARERFRLARGARCVDVVEETAGAVKLLASVAGGDRGVAERVAGMWTPRACSARKARQRVRKSSYHPRQGSSGPGAQIVTPQRRWWDGYIPGASGWCRSVECSHPAIWGSSLMRRLRRLVKPTKVSVRVLRPLVGKGCWWSTSQRSRSAMPDSPTEGSAGRRKR